MPIFFSQDRVWSYKAILKSIVYFNKSSFLSENIILIFLSPFLRAKEYYLKFFFFLRAFIRALLIIIIKIFFNYSFCSIANFLKNIFLTFLFTLLLVIYRYFHLLFSFQKDFSMFLIKSHLRFSINNFPCFHFSDFLPSSRSGF